MASFVNDLWTSVFEGGTNQSLVLATHGSFAALQATLFALLVVTQSWHFVFLSILCAGVWGGITWFIREVEEMKRVEAEGERLRAVRKENESPETVGETEDRDGDTSSEAKKDR